MKYLYYSRIVHFCNGLNLACGQCLHRSSMLRVLKLTPLPIGSTWYVLPQLSGRVAVSGTQNTKAFGLGFSDELALEENPLWVSTESIDSSRLMQNLIGSSFVEEK